MPLTFQHKIGKHFLNYYIFVLHNLSFRLGFFDLCLVFRLGFFDFRLVFRLGFVVRFFDLAYCIFDFCFDNFCLFLGLMIFLCFGFVDLLVFRLGFVVWFVDLLVFRLGFVVRFFDLLVFRLCFIVQHFRPKLVE